MGEAVLIHSHVVVRAAAIYNVVQKKTQVTYVCASPLKCAWRHILQFDWDVLGNKALQAAEAPFLPKDDSVQPV